MRNICTNNITLNDKISPATICQSFNQFQPDDCVLLDNRIDIWQYPLNNPDWKLATSLLNQTEKDRAAQFYFDKHRIRFILAHATLRLIISRYLNNKNPIDLEFGQNKYGKPKIINGELEFNLSHSGEMALLGVSKRYPLGIDLEFHTSRPYLDIGKSMFSNNEIKLLNQVSLELRTLTFFHIWAQKEAFIKACGMGLSYPTQEFTVSHINCTRFEVNDKLHNQLRLMTSFMPTIACSGAVCHDEKITEVRYIRLGGNVDFTK